MASPAIVNSLEAAWTYDTKLIGSPVPDAPPVAVFVTASRTRFSSVIPPHVKGLTMRMQTGEDFVILVHNDSVRAYSRHEVMHLVSFRAWGFPGPSATWLVEGVATFADGRCQGTTINAVARDILSQANAPTMQDVTHKFFDLMLDDRARAYVLAGTLTGYLWETRGVGAVKALWQGKDTLTALPTRVGSVGGAFLVDPAEAWRSYVRHAADTAAGISAASLRRFGCG